MPKVVTECPSFRDSLSDRRCGNAVSAAAFAMGFSTPAIAAGAGLPAKFLATLVEPTGLAAVTR